MSPTRWGRVRALVGAVAGGAAVAALAVGAAGPAGGAVPRAVRPATASTTYKCNNSLTGAVKFAGKVVGTTPASVGPTTAVKMSGYQVTITLPAAVTNELLNNGYKSLSAKATVLDVNSTDAKSKTVNAAKTALTFPSVNLVKNQAIPVKFPSKPTTIGSWTPSAAGTMTYTIGNATVSLSVAGLGSLTFTCTPSPAATISTTKVT